jgi:hypothetical protein
MKRLLLTSIFILSMSCISFATDKEMTNQEYINVLNNYVGEMKEITDIKEGSLFKSITKGFDDGYLVPDINRLVVLKDSCKSIADNMKDFKLSNKQMQSKHNELINKYYEVSDSLNDVLVAKQNLLNKDLGTTVKFGKLCVIDLSKSYVTNDKIEELNNIYKDINESL